MCRWSDIYHMASRRNFRSGVSAGTMSLPITGPQNLGGTVASESALRSPGTILSGFEPLHRRPGLTEGPKA
ncbi:hypothetical protein PoB_007544500 [Plakobranchus ocellatus]|uniref:Uncharacterized protein n=1 Tax=Plakobranchus ocellatus TaxID=259542 RepID=A0AAV4DXN3_9GAST|nr:hypothetical protein PoB_007544500 [Plakobranchus ocellatus]